MTRRIVVAAIFLASILGAQPYHPPVVPNPPATVAPPDILILSDASGSYCRSINDNRRLQVIVKNRSKQQTFSNLYVHVTFEGSSGSETARIGTLMPGARRAVSVPKNCSAEQSENCTFRILVTNRATIQRGQVRHASISGHCLG